MTKPTQAQIEAAAKVLLDHFNRGGRLTPYIAIAKATLIAAAEVDRGAQTGKALTGSLNEVSLGENSESVLHRHTAAADVEQNYDLKCTNGHDRCYMGTSDDCPYCERVYPAAAESEGEGNEHIS